jgi:hypothetical protein
VVRANREALSERGRIYKQINAPFGHFAKDALAAATTALASGTDADDSRYAAIQARIAALNVQRDALAAQIKTTLAGAWQGHVDRRAVEALTRQGEQLLGAAHALARL